MWNIHQFNILPSTQKLAKERLLSGKAEDSDVFIAHHQTDGKGRYADRFWLDEPNMNLLMSIVLTDIPEHLKDKMQFVAAISVLKMIRQLLHEHDNFFYDSVRLKWTNDILINDKKVAGVMTEVVWSGDTLKGVVIGIGINVNQENFPAEISDTAISLKEVTKETLHIEDISDLMLDELATVTEFFHSKDALMTDLRKELDWMRNLRKFSLTEPDGTNFNGLRYDGITNDGALRCILPQGEVKIFQNATLHLA
jgi:BirA family biotin operon repressor/biotin-[acetyl-CoA-carboxylase] ligase